MEFYSKDIQILRQSQIKLALEYINNLGINLTIEELQRMTDILVECGIKPIDNDLKERIKKLDKFILEKIEKNGKK